MVRIDLLTLKALIFDLDGVITSASAEYHYQSWQRLADEEGLPFDREANERLRGVNRMESLARFLDGRPIEAERRDDYLRRKQAYYLESLANMTPADRLPGVTALLEAARSAGLRLAVASASRNVSMVLEKLELTDYFDIIGDPSHVANPKPAPDIFLWVAGYLQAEVSRTIILEDSRESIDEARKVGFWTLGVGADRVDNAHLTAPDLAAIQLQTLLDLCAG